MTRAGAPLEREREGKKTTKLGGPLGGERGFRRDHSERYRKQSDTEQPRTGDKARDLGHTHRGQSGTN